MVSSLRLLASLPENPFAKVRTMLTLFGSRHTHYATHAHSKTLGQQVTTSSAVQITVFQTISRKENATALNSRNLELAI